MKEEWKQIKGYEDLYEISNSGRVWTCRSKRIMKPGVDNYGYRYVHLCDGKSKSYKVHRLVALHFIPLVEGKEIVNHIDENRKNNCFSNLEWCTYKHNANHGTKNTRMVKSRETSPKWLREQTIPIVGVNIETGECNYYKSMMEAERNGFHSGHISACVRGINKSHKGYKWFEQSEYKGVS
ncbi:NUMOD4 domain-containing protein [Staphylococcus xylosus]|uniref:NUMOD4 domain-containing protein n=1 Tax=Staphylococcus xylosus TaxID=1288 RepID=UPI003F54F108